MNEASNNLRLGIPLTVAAMFVFATQDGFSRHLAATYNVVMIVMVRYWFFGLFILGQSVRSRNSLRDVATTRQPLIQIARGVLLSVQILVMVFGFVVLGLVESHAVFACYPLLVALLAEPVLGERQGWHRRAAVLTGFFGVFVILRPGLTVFSMETLIPLVGAMMFALYVLLTRMAARTDSAATSFFWTGIPGVVVTTCAGVFFWEPMTLPDWGWMSALCVTGTVGHYLVIRSYEVSEAGSLQPFAYLHPVFASVLGIALFGDELEFPVAAGSVIIVSSGLYLIWRERLWRSS